MSETKSPGWMRAVQIGLGIIALVLSAYVLAFPAITFVTIVYVLGIVLLIVGIERVISGIFEHSPGGSRWGSVGLGILVIIIALIVMAFPVGTGVFLLILLALALLFDGIARVIHGFGNKTRGKANRTFSIIAGVIAIGLSIAIMASPIFGAELIGILLAIALIIIGIQIIVAGITGSRFAIRK
ncbi:hypothetical protein BH18THE2_BH18THE2_36750 [soil metagenome]